MLKIGGLFISVHFVGCLSDRGHVSLFHDATTVRRPNENENDSVASIASIASIASVASVASVADVTTPAEAGTFAEFAEAAKQTVGGATTPQWFRQYFDNSFETYRKDIDSRIAKPAKRLACTTTIPFFGGEFGYEIAGQVPWAYAESKSCNVDTSALKGTKYLYFFSSRHTIVQGARNWMAFPPGNPMGHSMHATDSNFPTKWSAPPFKSFFHFAGLALTRPLVMIFNKYTTEWGGIPSTLYPLKRCGKF